MLSREWQISMFYTLWWVRIFFVFSFCTWTCHHLSPFMSHFTNYLLVLQSLYILLVIRVLCSPYRLLTWKLCLNSRLETDNFLFPHFLSTRWCHRLFLHNISHRSFSNLEWHLRIWDRTCMNICERSQQIGRVRHHKNRFIDISAKLDC